MLVLSRYVEEKVVINGGTPEEVIVQVVEIRGDKVRLAFSGDRRIPIHRSEVYEAIERERAADKTLPG